MSVATLMDYFERVSAVCKEARHKARDENHRELYVARKFNRETKETDVFILDAVDFEHCRSDESVDVLAHITKDRIAGLGRVRSWLDQDGDLNLEFLTRR